MTKRTDAGHGGSPGVDEAFIFTVAKNNKAFFDRLREHYRQCKRKDVAIRASLSINLKSGKTVNSGHATITNISPTGALLTNLRLEEPVLPIRAFRIRMKLLAADFRGITVNCRPVRIKADGRFGLGVEFEGISVRIDES